MKKIIFICIILIGVIVCSYAGGESIGVNNRIAFVSNIDGNWDLFIMDGDGENAKRLTKTLYDEKDPSWSPDRKKIVYATTEGSINVIEVDTGKVETILEADDKGKSVHPVISPDDKEVIYVYFKQKKVDDTDLWKLDLETKESKLFLSQNSTQLFPSYSPDGRKIVYTSTHCSPDCGRIIQELWIADAAGGRARQLAMTNSNCMNPTWSPDGKKIAFTSDMKGNFDIWILDCATFKLTQLTQDPNLDTSPAWSPDGKKIAFISNRSGEMKIWMKTLATKDLKMIEPFPGKDIQIREVVW